MKIIKYPGDYLFQITFVHLNDVCDVIQFIRREGRKKEQTIDYSNSSVA